MFWGSLGVEEATRMELSSFDSVGIGAEVSVASELGESNDVAIPCLVLPTKSPNQERTQEER